MAEVLQFGGVGAAAAGYGLASPSARRWRVNVRCYGCGVRESLIASTGDLAAGCRDLTHCACGGVRSAVEVRQLFGVVQGEKL